MSKIPVGETIARAYGFAGRRIVPVLGLSWLPAAFFGVAAMWWLLKLSNSVLVAPPAEGLNDFVFFDVFCLVVLAALGNAVIAIALTREALNPNREWMTAYFAFGRREWALFAGLVAYYGVLIAALTAVIFAGHVAIAVSTPLLAGHLEWHAIPLVPLMYAGVTLVALGIGIFLAIQFGFFLAPVTADERRLRFGQTWTLSRGSFWRLLLVTLAISLPALLLFTGLLWLALGDDLGNAIDAISGRHVFALCQIINSNAGAMALLWALALIIFNALFAGASAFAYPIAQARAAERPGRSDAVVPAIQPIFAEQAFANYTPRNQRYEIDRSEPAFAPIDLTVPAVVETGHEDILGTPVSQEHLPEPAHEELAAIAEPALHVAEYAPPHIEIPADQIPPIDPAGALAVEAMKAAPAEESPAMEAAHAAELSPAAEISMAEAAMPPEGTSQPEMLPVEMLVEPAPVESAKAIDVASVETPAEEMHASAADAQPQPEAESATVEAPHFAEAATPQPSSDVMTHPAEQDEPSAVA